MPKTFKRAALALLAPAMVLTASPVLARDDHGRHDSGWHHGERQHDRWEGRRGDSYRDDYARQHRRADRRDYRTSGYYAQPVYANARTWQGDDGRTYCRRSDGTAGLVVGGVAGALIGREVAGRRGDRTVGAILGAAGGALLGRAIDRSGSNEYRCR